MQTETIPKGFSSTQCIHHAGFRADWKFRARWQEQ